MKKWYDNNPSKGVIQLCSLFGIEKERLEFLELGRKFANETNKATKKNHIHEHRDAGSKALKKYNRWAWDKKNGFIQN